MDEKILKIPASKEMENIEGSNNLVQSDQKKIAKSL